MNCKTMLKAICVDIVEMIILSSKDYELYETLCETVEKLKENSRRTRIRDKLTYLLKNSKSGNFYELNKNFNREYDKPSDIFNCGVIAWRNDGNYFRNGYLQNNISTYSRSKFNSLNDREDCPKYVCVCLDCNAYENPIYIWRDSITKLRCRTNQLPVYISNSGRREMAVNTNIAGVYTYRNVYVFDYI